MISAIQNFLERFPNKFSSLLPEVIVAFGLVCILFLGLFRLKNYIFIALAVAILLGAIVAGTQVSTSDFLYFRILVLANTLACILFFADSPLFKKSIVESIFLFLSSALGLNMMMLADDLLSLFVALELSAIASYIWVVLSWQKNSFEGTIKYLLFGVFASAIMLYGISWLYGLSGSINLQISSWKIPVSQIHYVAIFMMLSGLLMKISAVPYHIWTPDAYQIAPTPVVAFLATASKTAGIIAIAKIVKAYQMVFPDITLIIAFIAILSIFWGNLVAFWQKNLKRMLAYSSIANAGYLLIGTLNENYQNVLLFFLVVYSIANILILLIAEYYEHNHQFTDLEHFAGIGKTNTEIAATVLLGFVALAGLPPTAGFTAKLLIFSSLWDYYEATQQKLFLIWFILGLLNTFVALFYYLKIPYFAFFKQQEKNLQAKQKNYYFFVSITLLVILLVVLFVKPLLMTQNP